MGIGIIYDEEEEKAVFYCNITDKPFGPIIEGFGRDIAEAFLKFALWCNKGCDLRLIRPSELKDLYRIFEKLELADKPHEIIETDDVGERLIKIGLWDDEKDDFVFP